MTGSLAMLQNERELLAAGRLSMLQKREKILAAKKLSMEVEKLVTKGFGLLGGSMLDNGWIDC